MLVSAAWLGPALLGAIGVFVQARVWGGAVHSSDVAFVTGGWLVYGLLTPLVFVMARRWPLSRPLLASHVLLQLVVSLLFCVVWAGAGALVKGLLEAQGPQGGVVR